MTLTVVHRLAGAAGHGLVDAAGALRPGAGGRPDGLLDLTGIGVAGSGDQDEPSRIRSFTVRPVVWLRCQDFDGLGRPVRDADQLSKRQVADVVAGAA